MNRKRKYPFNQQLMDNINTHEKAYILGLLWADGCNHTQRNVITLSLKYPDKHILEEIMQIFEYQGKIYEYESSNQRILTLCSSHLSKKLEEYGMIKNKSLVLKFPTIIPSNLINSFILGYFDGDGSVFKKGNRCMINFAGSKDVLENIQKVLKRNCNLINKKLNKNKSIFTVTYGSQEECLKIKNFLYKDCKIFLNRKRDILDNCSFVKYESDNYKRNLNRKQIQEIRELLSIGNKKTNIAKLYNITPQVLHYIKIGKSYKNY